MHAKLGSVSGSEGTDRQVTELCGNQGFPLIVTSDDAGKSYGLYVFEGDLYGSESVLVSGELASFDIVILLLPRLLVLSLDPDG